ncbi:ammonium transporter [Xylophilus rhododendri]|uniref:Ammonium transporter n=1 Tax=Xylophilus rhododendri TaxID=2697032 RepID=A0A857J518_9BURK|nr:ammonium transporter [Xylophilus rhododendri]QHI99060.1 ammonium transporter [Xylophilus rhododendri]
MAWNARSWLLGFAGLLIGASALAQAAVEATAQAAQAPASAVLTHPGRLPLEAINAADTAWMIVASALVLLMTLPGVALFYAGMVRRKNVLNTMASVIGIAAVVTLLWFAVGYSWAFTPGNGFIGGGERMWFAGFDYDKLTRQVAVSHIAPNIPEAVFAMFQLGFAVITPALIVGSLVERMRFSALLWFAGLWSLVVYVPIAHWVWEPGGWLAQRGALDFAGGSVVHINAGVAGLVCAWMLGPRQGYASEPFEPFNLAMTMSGAGLLWIGWFGFNAGSAMAADGRAGLAFLATHLAAAAGALGWMAAEWFVRRRPSLLGLCSGAVAGLVAITPASGYVGVRAALLIGLVAGLACYWGATGLKRLLKADDALDVFGVHGVGGLVGCVMTGLFADPAIDAGPPGRVLVQLLDAGAVIAWSACGTALVLLVTRALVRLRVEEVAEHNGLDIAQHRERVAL